MRAEILAPYRILDTPRESEFDDLAEIASEVCEAPIALVNFFDDGRDFFKAEIGAGLRESPAETSFCRRATAGKTLAVVNDVANDRRFADNPLVRNEPKLRFYAGATIETGEGVPIGTVCVFDVRPRELNAHQRRTLELLARQATTQLELRRSLAERERALARSARMETDLRLAAERQNELSREIAHRMKNLLAMVQAIISQTLRQTADPEIARNAISTRIGALARAQDQLLRTASEEADIEDVVRTALLPHLSGEARFVIRGEERKLNAQQALGLSLALHELATNAVKYGALSNDVGTIEIRWTGGNEPFRFDWIETGGPSVEEPERSGFGSKLMQRIVGAYFSGTGTMEFAPSGLRFHLTTHP